MNTDALAKYLRFFADLHRNQSKEFGPAPHKPILLLALLDEIERGAVTNNLFRLTPELVASFRAYWRALVPPETWQERIVYPFRYLLQDGFWELIKNGVPLGAKELGHPTSIGQLAPLIDGGRFEADLWLLVQNQTARNALRTFLLQTYFRTTPADVQPNLPVAPLAEEAEKLTAQARSPFRTRRVRERTADEDGYFVRSALFPRVVRGLYDDACAVCGLNVHTDAGGGVVDGAHILPFAVFHNNDPRNGIAFCKNHHWGFDAGWFSVADDYRLVVSPRLVNGLGFVTAGALLRLPANTVYSPARQALAWHRDKVFQK